jgi:hypothetical protein
MIQKEADFLEGFLNQVKDSVDFKNKPFETLFGVFGTALSFKFGWVIGGTVALAEAMGAGPGWIGKLIDDYFFSRGSTNVKNMDLSESSLLGAATSATNEIMNKVKNMSSTITTESFLLNDIQFVKGYITENDIKVALYDQCIKKQAKISLLTKFIRYIKPQSLTGAISSILKMFAKGLLAVGVVGGVKSMLGVPSKSDSQEIRYDDNEIIPGMNNRKLQYYKNESKNVEDTIIKFLDAEIMNFSSGFEKFYGFPLKGSKQLSSIISDIDMLNWKKLPELNDVNAFVAPPLMEIAKKLLPPGANIEKLEKTKPNNLDAELNNIFGEK